MSTPHTHTHMACGLYSRAPICSLKSHYVCYVIKQHKAWPAGRREGRLFLMKVCKCVPSLSSLPLTSSVPMSQITLTPSQEKMNLTGSGAGSGPKYRGVAQCVILWKPCPLEGKTFHRSPCNFCLVTKQTETCLKTTLLNNFTLKKLFQNHLVVHLYTCDL